MSKNSFLKGAAILGIAGLMTKVLGAFYRIPLSNLIGAEGVGYYQTAYPLYTLLVTISTAGFPTAISKLISEKRALEDYRGAQRIFKVSFIGFILAGVITSLFVGLFSKNIVGYMKSENGYYALIALVPALLLVPIMSAFRGYFQGQQFMVPTAVSQVIEQLFRVGVGLTLANYLVSSGLPKAAGGASFGASAGALAGMIFIVLIYFLNRNKRNEEIESGKDYPLEDAGVIAKNILNIAVPITIGASMVPIINNLDTFIILRRLADIGYSKLEAASLFGQLTGNAQTIINFPQVISLSLAMSLVPAISDAITRKDYDGMRGATKSGLRMTLLIGLPSAIGIFVLSTPIIKLLYFNNSLEEQIGAGTMLRVLSISLIFLTVVQTLTAVLQGAGKPLIPVRNLGFAVIVKAVSTYILVGIPSLNAKGAAISTVLTYLTAATLDFISVKKITKTKFDMMNTFIKPTICSLIMGLAVYLTYILLDSIIGAKLSTVIAIGVGGLVYLIALVVLKAVTREDMMMLPKGEKIADKLKL
ncbi:MAG: polysaccharide biosynthesis protein [Andreesenia angusta]|nr:polysaccharide biosynthesis protein [Andreesenia angusta]